MFDRKRSVAPLGALVLALAFLSYMPQRAAAGAFTSPAAVPTVVESVDDLKTKALTADLPLLLHKVIDHGAIPGETRLERLQLVLKRSAARQAALDQLVADQLDKGSAQYHQWLAPGDFAARFGPAQSDIDKTVAWLQSHGFGVDEIGADHMSIAFTGTAYQVKSAFKTELHAVVTRDGSAHTANSSAPVIPAALAGVIEGVTLSNFFPRPTVHPAGAVARDAKTGTYKITKPAPGFTFPTNEYGTFYAVAPADLATIYNITPARAGTTGNIYGPDGNPLALTGKGVSLIVAEQSDIKTGDWTEFRKLYGLSGYAGKLTVVHPGGCTDPGFIPDEGEAALDAEWSGAVAPDAQIVFASCAETATTFGVMTTLENIVSHGPKAAAISVSYGGCEAGNGLAFQSQWTNLVERAAAEGYSVFISAGDGAGAGCDNFDTASYATGGLAVNGLASNIYDTAAGGTDFSDFADNAIPTYWSNKNGPSLGSAKSYIPEIPWDDSCAGKVLIQYLGAVGPITFCNSPEGSGLLDIIGGSGGKSLYYAKPAWQNIGVLGVPKDGARDLPDVSLFASSGFWQHLYVFCMSDTNQGGAPCSTTNGDDIIDSAGGGTSFVAPILAGIQALVAQEAGGSVGNAAPIYYRLAKLQFDTPYLLSTCKSDLGVNISPACVFNEITRGDNALPCLKGTPNCYTSLASTEGIGVLSTSTSAEDPAFPAQLGYSYAVGLGSINITNLLINYLYP